MNFNVKDLVIAGINSSLTAVFFISIYSDVTLVRRYEDIKKEHLKRLEKKRTEAEKFDFA